MSEDLVKCNVCGRAKPLNAILDHLHRAHNIDTTPEAWPDGDPVVVDHTLTPDQFQREGE